MWYKNTLALHFGWCHIFNLLLLSIMHLLLSPFVKCCVERECPQERFTSTLVGKIVANPLSSGRGKSLHVNENSSLFKLFFFQKEISFDNHLGDV
jgi:hypothetical protein